METEVTTPETGMVEVSVEWDDMHATLVMPEERAPMAATYFDNMTADLPLDAGEQMQEIANEVKRHINDGGN